MAEKTEFAVFCIENLAKKLGCSGYEAYCLLAEKSTILGDYIIPNYEALHTQGKDYIINDIIELMEEKGLVA